MAKERTTEKAKVRKREKKMTSGEVTKAMTMMQKRPATPAISEPYSDQTWTALLGAQAAGDASIPDSLGLKRKKQAETAIKADDDDDAGDGGALRFAIDTNPTPVDLATIKTVVAEEEEKTGSTQIKPRSLTKHPSGLNHKERRRLTLIDERMKFIKETMGISEGSEDRADEAQRRLDEWIENRDVKSEARAEKKRIQKARALRQLINKKSRKLFERGLKERTESETKGETKWQTKAELKAERKAAKKAAKDAKKAAKDAKRAAKRESMDPPKEHTKVKTRHVPT